MSRSRPADDTAAATVPAATCPYCGASLRGQRECSACAARHRHEGEPIGVDIVMYGYRFEGIDSAAPPLSRFERARRAFRRRCKRALHRARTLLGDWARRERSLELILDVVLFRMHDIGPVQRVRDLPQTAADRYVSEVERGGWYIADGKRGVWRRMTYDERCQLEREQKEREQARAARRGSLSALFDTTPVDAPPSPSDDGTSGFTTPLRLSESNLWPEHSVIEGARVIGRDPQDVLRELQRLGLRLADLRKPDGGAS